MKHMDHLQKVKKGVDRISTLCLEWVNVESVTMKQPAPGNRRGFFVVQAKDH